MPPVPTAGAISIDAATSAVPGLPATGWPLRRYLLVMTLAVLLPVLAFAGVLLWYDVTRQYDIHRRGMLDTVQAFSLAVDREWATVQAILQTLAASELLDTGDLRAFYDLCTRVVEHLSGARIVLFAPSGQQLLNTLRPFDAELPNPFTQSESSPPAWTGEVPLASAETVRRAFQTGQPVYSNLFIALVSLRPSVSLDVPVWRDGRIVYVLTMAMFPESFARLLQEQNLPVDALATILDQQGRIIARSQKPEQFVGQLAHPTLRAALATSATGWERNHSVEQVPVYSAWTRSAVTGWTAVISVTEASITRPIRQSLVFWGGGACLVLGLAVGLALLVARRITAPLAALTQSADLVQRGQPFAMPPVAVQEVRHLYAALMVAAEALHQQAAERERRLLAEAEAAERQRAAAALAEVNAALRQAEAAERAQREQWQTTLASIGDAVIVTDPAGHVGFLNPVAHALTGWAPDEAIGQPLPQVFRIVNEATRQPVESPVTRVVREGIIVGLANHTVLLAKDGREIPIDDSGAPIRDTHGQISGAVLVFRDITARKQAEAERAQQEATQRFLAQASALLSSSLDPTVQLEHLARLLIPTLADWCSIDLLQDDGGIHRVAVVHVDPAKAALAEQLRQHYPLLTSDASHTLVRVLRTGQAWFDPAASTERLRAEARDTAHWELTQALGFTAEIVVPLLARGRALGTITCVLGEGARRYSEADLALAEDLAHRAALALDNARLYQEARTAQAALEQANAALRAQEEQLRVITDSVPGFIAYVDRSERYRFVNAAYERRFGVPRTQLLGRSIRDLRESIYAHLQPYLARALAGEPVTFENTYESAADAPALQVSYVPDRQPDGQVAGLYVLITDITAQRQAQAELARLNQALQASEAQLQAIYTHAMVGISQTSLTGQLLRVNPRFCEITGYSEAELLDRPFYTITHPEDVPTNLDLYRRLQAGEFPSYHMEKRYLRPDGQIVWTELTGTVVRDAAGVPQYGVAVIQDITARKEAEARLRESEARLAAVLQQLPVAVGLIDTEGGLVVSNARMRTFIPARIPSHDPAGGVRWRTFTDDGSRLEPDQWPGARALRGEVVAPGVEFLYTTEDGHEIWTRVATAPFHNAEGQITGAIMVIQDINAVKRAEAALRDLNATLEQRVAERTRALEQAMAEQQRLEREARRTEHFALLGRLAAGVAHELRNPLGAVFLHVDLLAEELAQPSPDSPEAVAEALATIKTSLARVDDLMQDYLALVRVHTIQREVQDLGRAVTAWGREFQGDIVAHGVTLQVDGVERLGPVAFHANTLRRALLNLVQNAAEAMPQGGTITLTGQGTAEHVQLEVRDTGSGIPAERLAQIFEPLYTTKPGGTGLGLYLVQEIITAHGGQVTVQSGEGQGTTFTLTLPRVADAPAPDAAHTPAAD